MKTALAIFVKTPGYSAIKTRLAADIGTAKAEKFYVLSVQSISAVAQEVEKLSGGQIVPYWAVAEEAAMEHDLWQNFSRINQGVGGLGDRLHRVYSTLLNDHDVVLLIGADSPQLRPEHIIQAADLINPNQFVLGPAEDGGFYLFGGARSMSHDIWTAVSYSSKETMKELSDQVKTFANLKILSRQYDVDTVEDLTQLSQSLQSCRFAQQKELLNWLGVFLKAD